MDEYIEVAAKNSLLSTKRLELLAGYVRQTKDVAGHNAEVGVYKGGSAYVIAHESDRDIYLFDTFYGMPKPDKRIDVHEQGDFADTDQRKVEALLEPLKRDRIIKCVRGEFPWSIDIHRIQMPDAFAFVHVDCDLYASAMACFEYFWPIMSIGAIMVIDDYGWYRCPGIKEAAQKYFKKDRGDCALGLEEYQGVLRKER